MWVCALKIKVDFNRLAVKMHNLNLKQIRKAKTIGP